MDQTPGSLLCVHALVCQLQCESHTARILRNDDNAAGGRNREAASLLRQRRSRFGHEGIAAREATAKKHAELVAANPVGLSMAIDGYGERRSKPREQSVPCTVAKAVVVVLEAVQIEERKRRRLAVQAALNGDVEVVHQASPVAKACQGICDRIAGLALEHPHVLQIREPTARTH